MTFKSAALPGAQERVGEPVEEGHEVDQPELVFAVNEQQKQNDCPGGEVAPEQQGAPRQPVDDQARERGQEGGDDEGEEHEAGFAVAPGQHLDPDAHGEEHRRVAEEREGLADEVAAGVAVAEEVSHHAAPVGPSVSCAASFEDCPKATG